MPVMLEFRNNIIGQEYLNLVKELIENGHVMIFIEDFELGEVGALSVFETGYKLHCGNYLYIDDLTTLRQT